MGRRPKSQVIAVERQDQVDEVCAECRRNGRFAYDTEFVMEDSFESEVCLIQIATESTVAMIDPLLDLDIQGVWELICDAEVETVVHAGQEDLNLGARHTGRPPRRIFDLQIAAGLVGFDYPISLQRLVQSIRHVRLHKSKTLTDWRRRPLTSAQIHYGAEDVAHLLALHDELKTRLRGLKRTEWAAEEFAACENMSLYKPTRIDRVARLKGTASFNGQQLATVGELLAWREGLARKLNRPARVILRDHLVVEIAKHAIKDAQELRELRGMNLSGHQARALCGVVDASLQIPESEWPAVRAQEFETPREATLVALSTAVLRSFCLDNNLAYSLAATQKNIRALVRHCTGTQNGDRNGIKLLTGWRGKAVGKMLEQILGGRGAIQVEPLRDGGGRIHILPLDKTIAPL